MSNSPEPDFTVENINSVQFNVEMCLVMKQNISVQQYIISAFQWGTERLYIWQCSGEQNQNQILRILRSMGGAILRGSYVLTHLTWHPKKTSTDIISVLQIRKVRPEKVNAFNTSQAINGKRWIFQRVDCQSQIQEFNIFFRHSHM